MSIESDNIQTNKIDPKPYISILKRQYSKYELMLFYLYMQLHKNETYKLFFKKHSFFTNLKKSEMYQLLENITICGSPIFNDTLVDFIYYTDKNWNSESQNKRVLHPHYPWYNKDCYHPHPPLTIGPDCCLYGVTGYGVAKQNKPCRQVMETPASMADYWFCD